jgi:hypothetical protein
MECHRVSAALEAFFASVQEYVNEENEENEGSIVNMVPFRHPETVKVEVNIEADGSEEKRASMLASDAPAFLEPEGKMDEEDEVLDTFVEEHFAWGKQLALFRASVRRDGDDIDTDDAWNLLIDARQGHAARGLRPIDEADAARVYDFMVSMCTMLGHEVSDRDQRLALPRAKRLRLRAYEAHIRVQAGILEDGVDTGRKSKRGSRKKR